MKISYGKRYGPDGTVYSQTISMSLHETNIWNNYFLSEIARGLPLKKNYVSTSGYEIFMRPLVPATDDWNFVFVIYLTNVQLQYIRFISKNKRILDRNTRIVIE